MATSSLHVSYRPVRVGFLVRPDVMDDFIQAVEWATAIWGGIFSPILPLLSDDVALDALIARWNVDVLAPVVLSRSASSLEDEALSLANSVMARHEHLAWPGRVGHLELFAPIGGQGELPLMSVDHIADHLWQEEYRHRDESDWILPFWAAGDPLSPLLSAMFGAYGSSPTGVRLRRFYQRLLLAGDADLRGDLPAETAAKGTPLALTGIELHRYGGFADGDGAFLGDPTHAGELRLFWNLRAAGHMMTFIPEGDHEGRLQAHTAEFLQRIPPQRPAESWGTLWRSRTWAADEQLPDSVQTLIPEGMFALRGATSDEDAGRSERERGHFKTEYSSVLASVEETSWRTQMIFSLPPRPFGHSRLPGHFAHWAVAINPLSEYAYRPRSLRIPALPDLNRWASKEMTAGIIDLRVQRESLDAIVPLDDSDLSLGLLDGGEIVRRVLERAGIEAATSPSGEVTSRIITQMDGLQACRILWAPGVRKVLSDDDARLGDVILNEIRRGGNLEDVPRAKEPTQAFDRLLDTEVLRPFLRIKCPECRLWRLFEPESLQAHLRCPGCGSVFPLAYHLRRGPDGQRSSWRFCRSGLLAERGHAGAIPVILTMLRLSISLDSGKAMFVLPSLDLTGTDLACETDVLAIEIDMHGKPSVIFGEVKSGGSEIDDNDISNLDRAAEYVRESGVSAYLVFAKLGSFSDDELARFRAYYDGGRKPVVLLAERELVHYEVLHDTRDSVETSYILSLADLAATTSGLYLTENTSP
jgi:ribosomal protein S27E